MRVLHVEDDASVARMVALKLATLGWKTESTDLGEEGVDLAKRYDFDLVITDGHLPDMSGVQVISALRKAAVTTPVLMLSSDEGLSHKAAAFSAGADDFLAKPCHLDEVAMRVQALIRRSKGVSQPDLEVGPIAINLAERVARVNGAPVHLTGKEYQLLELLALRRGQTITKEAILDHLYGGMDEPAIKIVDVFICKIRNKLRAAGADGYLQTIWGRGYVLRPEKEAPRPAILIRAPAMGSRRDRILALLGQRAATFAEIAEAISDANVNTLRATISSMIGSGEILNQGGPKAAIYGLARRVAA